MQSFGNLIDDTLQSVHASVEDIEFIKSFIYLGSIVDNNDGSHLEVT